MVKKREDLSLGERFLRAATFEGIVVAFLMMVWLTPLLAAGMVFVFTLLAVVGLLILWFTLESGSTAMHWMFGGLYGMVAAGFAVAFLSPAGSSLGVALAMSCTLIVFEMLHSHNLRTRNAVVDSGIRIRHFAWLAGIGVVSIVFGFLSIDNSTGRVSWLFVPIASLGLFALVVGLTVGPIVARKGSTTKGRWRPADRLPPAPGEVDPLVEEARSATRYLRAPEAPPAPTRSSTRFSG